jgi:hypothetical protein
VSNRANNGTQREAMVDPMDATITTTRRLKSTKISFTYNISSYIFLDRTVDMFLAKDFVHKST